MKKAKREHLEPIMRKDITYISGIQMEEAVEIVRHCFFRDEEMQVTECEVRDQEQFHEMYMKFISFWNFERCISELHENTGKESFFYYGKCAVCDTPQPFLVDYQMAEMTDGKRKLNWRERLVCLNCRCNSRERFILHKIFEHYEEGEAVLLYEKNSNVYHKAAREIENLTGFEYAGTGYNQCEAEETPCEDICRLSFENESFSLVVAEDVFEHTPEYEKAFQEAYRVLKPGGKLIFTVPFDGNNPKTSIRAELGENGIVSTQEEWYHGTRIPKQAPLLVCQIFGWDMLDVLRKCGFKDACGKVYYGLKEGYLGYLPLYFEAYK